MQSEEAASSGLHTASDVTSRTSAEHLAVILNAVPHVIWTAKPDGSLDFVSQQWTRLYGGKTEQLIGDGWIEAVHPDERQSVVDSWSAALQRGQLYKNTFQLRVPSGEYRWAMIVALPDFSSDGTLERWIGTCTDIHEQICTQKALDEKRLLYRSVLEASADCIKVLTVEGKLQIMNDPGLRLMELENLEPIKGRLWWELWPNEMQARVRHAVRDAATGQIVRFSGACPTATGVMKWWDVVVTPIRAKTGETTGILSISRDSTADRLRSQELEWASEHDALTGLPNRRAFQKRLQAAVLRSMGTGSKLGLLLVDLDHFKHVNDTLGHPAGDDMLKEIAVRLRSSLRASDFVARLGGDEFAIVVEGVATAADLTAVGEKALKSVKSPLRLQGRALTGGASIGGALFPDDAQTANELLKVADTALYALKAEGRGGTKLFHAYMKDEAQRVASQLSVARVAVNEGTVRPYYQRQVDLASGVTVGLEALLRWLHPSKGLQLPDMIEESFKDYELASKIGSIMQDKVLEDAKGWLACQCEWGRVSINAAPAEFLRDDYAERLLARLRAFDVPASAVEIEITEHVLMARGSKVVDRALAALKAAGVTIALDDFGTGYSSLSHLRDFPVDVVKIDKSFIKRMLDDQEIGAIVTGVINLARSLNIISVAEGIETPEQAQMLRAAGCHVGQGYLFGVPQPAHLVTMSAAKRAA